MSEKEYVTKLNKKLVLINKKINNRLKFRIRIGDSCSVKSENNIYVITINNNLPEEEIEPLIFHEVMEAYIKNLSFNSIDPHLIIDLLCHYNFNDYSRILESKLFNESKEMASNLENSKLIENPIKINLLENLEAAQVELALRMDNMNTIERIINSYKSLKLY